MIIQNVLVLGSGSAGLIAAGEGTTPNFPEAFFYVRHPGWEWFGDKGKS